MALEEGHTNTYTRDVRAASDGIGAVSLLEPSMRSDMPTRVETPLGTGPLNWLLLRCSSSRHVMALMVFGIVPVSWLELKWKYLHDNHNNP